MPAWRRLAASLAALALALVFAGSAFAHDGGPGIVVQPPIVAPGEEINVRGDNLWTDADVHVTLLGPAGERTPLGAGMTDGEAHLDLVVTLPSNLAPGSYDIEVSSAFAESVTANLQVASNSPAYLVGLLAAAVAGLVLVIVTARMLGSRRSPPSG